MNIIVIGASAGGVEALERLVRDLPSDLQAAICVTLHFPSDGISHLPKILSRAGSLPASHPRDGEAIASGHIYIAPPDYHLVLDPGKIRLVRSPRENGHRPAIDPLFRSAATAYQERVIGVILTGLLDDGTAGLRAIKERGGFAIVQDPQEALFQSMPKSAITHVPVDRVLPLAEIVSVLLQHLQKPLVSAGFHMSGGIEKEMEFVEQEKKALAQGERSGSVSMMTCPDGGGVLWELPDGNRLRFRCHVGHVYSPDSLVSEQDDNLEVSLWTAIRALEERAALAKRLATQASEVQRSRSEAQFLKRAAEAECHADRIRRIIMGGLSRSSEADG